MARWLFRHRALALVDDETFRPECDFHIGGGFEPCVLFCFFHAQPVIVSDRIFDLNRGYGALRALHHVRARIDQVGDVGECGHGCFSVWPLGAGLVLRAVSSRSTTELYSMAVGFANVFARNCEKSFVLPMKSGCEKSF